METENFKNGDYVTDEHGHIGRVEITEQGLRIVWDDGDITGISDAAHCDIVKIDYS